MYTKKPSVPFIINLSDALGFSLRNKTADYISQAKNTTGAERGSMDEQTFGALAEIVVRNQLGLPNINPSGHPLGFDLTLPTGIKVDVKCRGGVKPFQEEYEGSDGLKREAKHNFFARQIFDEDLDTDIYLLTHLEHPSTNFEMPGTSRQRKWKLYICGWISKNRVKREGVFLPRGAITERGRRGDWFSYRGHEIELYNRNLNGLDNLQDLAAVDSKAVKSDKEKRGDLNLTSVDAIRITYDLIGRGVLKEKHLKLVEQAVGIRTYVKPMLHPNQYHHLLQWLEENKIIGTPKERRKLQRLMPKVEYEGLQ